MKFLHKSVRFRAVVVCIFLCIVNCYHHSRGQEHRRIDLINSDQISFNKTAGSPVRKLLGNVAFRQDTITMYCDSAYQYIDENRLDLLSNVRIILSSGASLTADRIVYYGESRVAELYQNIVVNDFGRTLRTNRMTYYRTAGYGYYQQGGELTDGENILTSQWGYYYTGSGRAFFRKQIQLKAPEYTLTTDSLEYLSSNRTAIFVAPTYILTADSTRLYTEKGYYRTQTRETHAWQAPWYQDKDFSLAADTIYYHYQQDSGIARCAVRVLTADSSTYFYGEKAFFKRKTRQSILTDHAWVLQKLADDTLLVFADTLFAQRDSIRPQLRAFADVSVAMRQLQAHTDSLVYALKDSILTLYKDPVLFSDNNQLSADTIWVYVRNKRADSLRARKNAFLLSQETPEFYNQLQSRTMTARLDSNQIKTLWLEGNSETIYFLKDGDRYTGMNRSFSDKVEIHFRQNRPRRIIFRNQPNATFFPLHEVYQKDNQLSGFRLRFDRRPERYF